MQTGRESSILNTGFCIKSIADWVDKCRTVPPSYNRQPWSLNVKDSKLLCKKCNPAVEKRHWTRRKVNYTNI